MKNLFKTINHYWWGRNRPEVVEYEQKMITRNHLKVHPKEPEVDDCGDFPVLLGWVIGIVLLVVVIAQLHSSWVMV